MRVSRLEQRKQRALQAGVHRVRRDEVPATGHRNQRQSATKLAKAGFHRKLRAKHESQVGTPYSAKQDMVTITKAGSQRVHVLDAGLDDAREEVLKRSHDKTRKRESITWMRSRVH